MYFYSLDQKNDWRKRTTSRMSTPNAITFFLTDLSSPQSVIYRTDACVLDLFHYLYLLGKNDHVEYLFNHKKKCLKSRFQLNYSYCSFVDLKDNDCVHIACKRCDLGWCYMNSRCCLIHDDDEPTV